jgi:hypothetical protein
MNPALACCLEFVAFVEAEPVASSEDLRRLQSLLLLMASCATDLDLVRPPTGSAALARIDQERISRAQISARFPQLGFYWVPLRPRAVPENTRMGIGDAIDDLQDLYGAARDVVEARRTEELAEAIADFLFDFDIDWGTDAAALIGYLQELRSSHEI